MSVTHTDHSLEHLKSVTEETLDTLLSQTQPVKQVDDPYEETDIHYIVVAINPCSPLIREVPRGTEDAYTNLADAKEAARQIIQTAIAEAQQALSDLRQLGIEKINYISL